MSAEPERWIVIPNWERFQHYRDRNPPWIKLYTELNSKDEWCNLTYAERGLLATIWIEYARARGELRVERVPSEVGNKHRARHLQSLSDAGFIRIVASRPLAQRQTTETEPIGTKNGRPATVRANAEAYQPFHTTPEPVT